MTECQWCGEEGHDESECEDKKEHDRMTKIGEKYTEVNGDVGVGRLVCEVEKLRAVIKEHNLGV